MGTFQPPSGDTVPLKATKLSFLQCLGDSFSLFSGCPLSLRPLGARYWAQKYLVSDEASLLY
jgi:hypothetical protein